MIDLELSAKFYRGPAGWIQNIHPSPPKTGPRCPAAYSTVFQPVQMKRKVFVSLLSAK